MKIVVFKFSTHGDPIVGIWGGEIATVKMVCTDLEHEQDAIQTLSLAFDELSGGFGVECRIENGYPEPEKPSVYDQVADLYEGAV